MEWVIARWITFVATLLVTGACTTAWLVLRAPTDDAHTQIARDAARAALIAALVAVPAMALRLVDQVLAVQSPDVSFAAAAQLLLGSTTWGTGFLAQGAALLLACAGCALAWRTPRGAMGWVLAATGALGLCATPSLQGHAIGSETNTGWAVAADIAHVGGAALWLGTLGIIAALGVALPDPDGAVTPARATRADARLRLLVPLVPRVALPGAALLLGGGVLATLLHVTAVSDLWTTEWGRYVAVKLALVLVIVTLGALNWKRLGPQMQHTDGGVRVLRRTLLVELAASALVLVVTAVLVITPLPGE